MDEVQAVFDTVIEDYPTMKAYLNKGAKVMHNQDFESGIVKIMKKEYSSLTDAEKEATSRLKVQTNTENVSHIDGDEGSYYEQILKKQRLSKKESEQYMDCAFCVATSNTVKRVFSACKHILTDERKCMSPIMFESLIFLKVNKNFWDCRMVAKAMKSEPKQTIDSGDWDDFY